MSEYSEDTYGELIADVYDDWYAAVDPQMLEMLTRLAGGGKALELGIGTGRVAIPLAESVLLESRYSVRRLSSEFRFDSVFCLAKNARSVSREQEPAPGGKDGWEPSCSESWSPAWAC